MSTSQFFTPNHRVLVVDDNEAIHADLRKVLAGDTAAHEGLRNDEAVLFGKTAVARAGFDLDFAFQGEEALAKAEQALREDRPYAVAFVDVRMPPGWDGIETISRLWKLCPEVQVVLCTAYADYSWEDIMRRLGHSDSLLILKKPFDAIEVLQTAHALARKWLLNRQAKARVEDLDRMVLRRTAELQTANERLRGSEQRFARAFAASPVPFAILSQADGRFVDVNQRFLQATGFAREEIIGRTAEEISLWPAESNDTAWTTVLKLSSPLSERRGLFRTRTGESRPALVSAEVIQLADAPHRLLMLQDISERMRLEDQVRHAQKTEAVGQLVAGMAHHFNNLHQIIHGHVSICLDGAQDAGLAESLREIDAASRRAATLIRQLLAFNSKQVLRFDVLDLNRVLKQLASKLGLLLGPGVKVELQLASELPAVRADPRAIEQLLVELVRNASEAMPSCGRLTLRTETVKLDDRDIEAASPVLPGSFVCLSVIDTGAGMDADTKQRVFEPFFTTKTTGEGTGLGLATVYGIVNQHNGLIRVHSELGQGATFEIFLPMADRPAASAAPKTQASQRDGAETILLAEDDDGVRHLAQKLLEQARYRVLAAQDGEEALRLYHQHANEVDLLLLDVVMPRLGGKAVADAIKKLRPALPCLFASGYSSEMLASVEKEKLIQKPFSPQQLLRVVRETLNAGPRQAPGQVPAS